ncbi:HEPN domain-containing protein [Clostridium estertheticum]|uniref:Apea-like HEPN domain-containing protein n=1 Tax=Clostridium estertheticum TaxID=238834 RepID=A0A7Y3SWC8_9CLOT|nr:HEPN domain-containing protein [Clostridium estertheticum]NNU76554.1 hypothetical protein [Clostridium estertheticum]WBL49720.1 hypothetical protein LOR37_23470 [Clostridium estertheticum]
MDAEVKAEIKVEGFSEEYEAFLEHLSSIDIRYKSDYFKSAVRFNICFNENVLILKQIFSLSNNTIEDFNFNDIFNRESVNYAIMPQEFEVRLFDLFLAIQISRPGEMDFKNVKIHKNTINDENYKNVGPYYKGLNNPSFTTLEFLDDKDKQKYYHQFDFEQVWCWLNNFDEFQTEVPKTKLGKALNYIRYMFIQDSIMNIIWIIMALESLLVENQTFNRNQLYGKINTLHKYFDIEPFSKKEIKDLYEFRSKIVHGNQMIYRPTLQYNALNDVEVIDNKIEKYGRMAHEMFLLCIRYLIENNKYELSFDEIIEYKLKG